MNNAKILTQIVSINGCTVKMSFTQEDNAKAAKPGDSKGKVAVAPEKQPLHRKKATVA